MRQVQKPEEIAENAASVPLRSEENAHVESHHKGADNQVQRTPAGQRQRQRQPRTCFSSLQRYELERAFNQSNYLTTDSCLRLQGLGIPKRTIMVWFKNRRVKSKKEVLQKTSSSGQQLPPAAKSLPVISASQNTILQPMSYFLNEVQNACIKGSPLLSSREHWPYSSTGRIVSKSLSYSGMTLTGAAISSGYKGGTWSHGESLSMYTDHDSSPGSFETTVLSYSSSGRQLSINSNVPWTDTVPYLTASLPLNHQGDQRVPEGNKEPGPQQWVQRGGPHSTVPWIESQITVTTYSTVPWIGTAQGLRSSLPDDSGAQQLDQRDDPRSIASWKDPQVTETSHSMALMCPPPAPEHELEYTPLLDDVLAVLKLDLATQNNTADPSFLGNIDAFLPRSANFATTKPHFLPDGSNTTTSMS